MQTDAFNEHSVKQSKGSVNPYVNFSDLAWYEFALPPMDEQQRIAEILWAAERSIEATEDIVQQTRQCREALSARIFGAESANDVSTRKLSDVLAYASDGPFGSKLKTEHYAEVGARVIRLQNIGHGTFDDSDRAYISADYYQELTRYDVHEGDVVVAGLGDETHPVGRACQVPASVGSAINKADCFCLRGKTELIRQDYLVYFLNSSFAQRQILQRSQGTTRLRINVGNLKTITIPVPSLDRQLQICQTFAALDRAELELEMNIRTKKALVSRLRESLLNWSGEQYV